MQVIYIYIYIYISFVWLDDDDVDIKGVLVGRTWEGLLNDSRGVNVQNCILSLKYKFRKTGTLVSYLFIYLWFTAVLKSPIFSEV